jgi:hypothetical protein
MDPMNRRVLLRSLAASCAAVAGASVTAEAVQAPKSDLLVVISVDEWLSDEDAERLRQCWTEGVKGTEFEKAKAVALGRGMALTFYDANGKPVTVTREAAQSVLG